MKISKLVCHDLRRGLLRKSCLVALFLPLAPCMIWYQSCKWMGQDTSWMEYMSWLFKGSIPVQPGMSLRYVEIPFFWLTVMIYPAFVCVRYPMEDLSEAGVQLLFRCGSRSVWFLSKCLWVMVGSGVYLLLLAVSTAVFTALTGGSFAIRDWEELYCSIFLPFLAIWGLNQLSLTLGVLLSPIGGLLVHFSLAAAAVYWNTPWIYPNCAMTLRNKEFEDPAWICLAMLALEISAGVWFFQRRDILPGKREV